MAEIYKIDSEDIFDKVSQFGGTNLMPNTRDMPLGKSNWAIGQWRLAGTSQMERSRIQIDDGPWGPCYCFELTGTQTTTTDTSCFGIDGWEPWEIGNYYTFSLYARVLSGTGVAGVVKHYNKTLIRTNATSTWGSYDCISLTQDWQRVWVVWQPTAAKSNIYFGGAGTDATIQLCMIKLEKGNKPTGWTPAPQDLVKVSETELQFF